MFPSYGYLRQRQNPVNLHKKDVAVSLKSRNILLSLAGKYLLQQQGKPFSRRKTGVKETAISKNTLRILVCCMTWKSNLFSWVSWKEISLKWESWKKIGEKRSWYLSRKNVQSDDDISDRNSKKIQVSSNKGRDVINEIRYFLFEEIKKTNQVFTINYTFDFYMYRST